MTKTEQMKQFFIDGEFKKCLQIACKFKQGFTIDEIKTISRAYEMYSNERFFVSIGYNFIDELNKAKQIIKNKYKIRENE